MTSVSNAFPQRVISLSKAVSIALAKLLLAVSILSSLVFTYPVVSNSKIFSHVFALLPTSESSYVSSIV